MEGKVKFFNREKKFGFIQGDDGKEYFVHISGLAEGTFIRDDDRVSFDPVETERGLQAQNVTLLQKASEMKQDDSQESDEDDYQEEDEDLEDAA